MLDVQDTMEDARGDLTASRQEHQGRGKEQEVQGAKFVLARHNYLKSLAAHKEEVTKPQDSRQIGLHAKVSEFFVSRVKKCESMSYLRVPLCMQTSWWLSLSLLFMTYEPNMRL